jgi:hypothetical protein
LTPPDHGATSGSRSFFGVTPVRDHMTSFKGPLLLVGAMALFALLDANSKLL